MDYAALITSQHKKPKFTALVEAVSSAFNDIATVYSTINTAFDLDTAIGVQLDAIGLWVGLSRVVEVPLTSSYFSFDIAGLGYDEGYIKGKYDPAEGPTVMDDTMYRAILRVKIMADHWDGTNAQLEAIYNSTLSRYGATVAIDDHQDMTFSVNISGGSIPPVVMALLENGYLSVKPSGVLINGYFTV